MTEQRESKLLRKRYDGVLERARWALFWEKLWPVLWRWIGLAALFCTVSWLGVWGSLSGNGRFIGVLLFAALLLWFGVVGLFRIALPTYPQARNRVERDSDLRHNPAHVVDDELVVGAGDPISRRLWQLHQKKALESVQRMQVRWPSPGMPAMDPKAIRFTVVITAIAAAFYAGDERDSRLKTAFLWQSPESLSTLARTTGWVAPPPYTGRDVILLNFSMPGRTVTVPIGSTVVVHAGTPDTSISAAEGLEPVAGKNDAAGDRTGLHEFILRRSSEVTASTNWFNFKTFRFDVIPDTPPEISLADADEPIRPDFKGGFKLSYTTTDDYGIAAVRLVLRLAPELNSPRSVVPPPQIKPALPTHEPGEHTTEAEIDVSDHPWAGAPVDAVLVAVDDFGHEAMSAPFRFTLPERRFTDPLAAAFAEQRRKTVIYPDDTRKVQTALDALLIEPGEFLDNSGLFVAMNDIAVKLRRAGSDTELVDVADSLWALVLTLDDGRLSDAKAALKAAQERLEDAIARGASDEEIKQLTREYQNAMNRYMRELARQAREGSRDRQPKSGRPLEVSREQLHQLLKQIEEAMARGDMVLAQRLMEQLAMIMENLEVDTADGRGGDPLGEDMEQSSRELNELMQQQQQLMDETFSERRDRDRSRRQNREQQEQEQQQGQPGRQQAERRESRQAPGAGEEGEPDREETGSSLADRQQRLREGLERLQRDMKGMGMEKEQDLSDAEKGMERAEEAIRRGQLGEAVDSQREVLRNLERGAREFARQRQEMLEAEGLSDKGNGRGEAGRNRTGVGNPFGVESEADLNQSPGTRVQRIIEELRRKLGEPERRQEELNYFERLLKFD
jgi:uncharacterized protein (TIGR02302 family)